MSVLTGIKPTVKESKLKLLIYGDTGVGKSFISTQFPKPYYFDTEKSIDKAQYVENLNKVNGVIVSTQDFDEIYKQIRGLATEVHHYKSVVIDSLTWVYASLLRQCEAKVSNAHGRHYGEADKRMRELIDLILRLDMHVVVIAHSKDVRDTNGGLAGTTFDSYKKLAYMFDLVLEAKKGRYALVIKSRLREFAELDKIPFSYEEISLRGGIKADDKHIKLDLISADTQRKLEQLIPAAGISEELVNKWLLKAQVSTLDQLDEFIGLKLIDYCLAKIASV
jgi:hypothetical protein